MKTIFLGVSDFALPVPRTGSIETHSGYGPLPTTGQELHALVQGERQAQFPEYQSEVKIQQTFERGGYKFLVSGRMDGFFARTPPRIEEIKTAFNAHDLYSKLQKDPTHPYRLQLQTYAYLHWLQSDQIAETVLHIVSSRTGEGEDLLIDFNPQEYETWLDLRLTELVNEVKALEKVERRRKKTSDKFAFPFENPRPGQMELVQTIETSMADRTALLVQAPTGLGKTAGVLYPSLKEALSRGQRAIYVTPKNSQHAVAEDAVRRFQHQGSKVKALTINAKSKMCFKAETVCNPQYCEFAKDYYAKVDRHRLVDQLAKKKNLTPRVFKKIGETYEVCPFELQLEVADRVDVIICDYNYVFSPRNSLGRLTQERLSKKGKPNLVIDEAHNLPSRAMDYFSPMLSALDWENQRERVRKLPAPFAFEMERLLDKAIHRIELSRPENGLAGQITPDPEPFMMLDQDLRSCLTRYLESDVELEPKDVVLRLCNQWSEFTESLQHQGEKFFVTFRPHPKGSSLKVTCCDASEWLAEGYKAFSNVVGFSATLKPFDYYAKLSGLSPDKIRTAEFTSPFPKENRKLLIIPQVSTKFSDRERNYAKIKQAVERIVSLRRGNYFIFFPSFDFMEKVLALIDLPSFQILKQQREMSASQVKAFLEELKKPGQATLIFAVQGGVFAEGVDYPGDMLIGALIVGPALPSFDLERELLRAYYDKHHGSGFDYAYTYPAMAKVIQSAGRVIRSQSDRGLIVLMDQRFVHGSYTKSMPKDWFEDSVQSLVSQQLLTDIAEFWSDQ